MPEWLKHQATKQAHQEPEGHPEGPLVSTLQCVDDPEVLHPPFPWPAPVCSTPVPEAGLATSHCLEYLNHVIPGFTKELWKFILQGSKLVDTVINLSSLCLFCMRGNRSRGAQEFSACVSFPRFVFSPGVDE